jgi:hypothetical protein
MRWKARRTCAAGTPRDSTGKSPRRPPRVRPGAKTLHRPARHKNRHVRRGPADDKADGEEGKTGEHWPPERHTVGQRPGQHDTNQACQLESAEHPSVQTKISQVTADHRQDGSDGERLERDEGDREQ